MKRDLHRLIAEEGDTAFPHSPATSEALRKLFRAKKAQQEEVLSALLALVHSDPGFAFNVARLFQQSGKPIGTGLPVDLRARLEALNPFTIVGQLAGFDSYAYEFEDNPELLTAYESHARAASGAAAAILADRNVPREYGDVAAMMAMAEWFAPLALANLALDASLPVVAQGADAEQACRDEFGFGLGEFAAALADRYELPLASNPIYPGVVRDRVRHAVATAAADRGGNSQAGAA